jgi:hypothetical protein
MANNLIYKQNKLILHVSLDNKLKEECTCNPFLRINELVLAVCHFQYPCVLYSKIYQHFRLLLSDKINSPNIRLKYNGF